MISEVPIRKRTDSQFAPAGFQKAKVTKEAKMVYVTLMSNRRQMLGTLAFFTIPASATVHYLCSPANTVSFDTARTISLAIETSATSGCVGGILWEREGVAVESKVTSPDYWLAEGRY